jgi:uncharacterized membrane protein YoaK (UPF0700 family)
VLDTVDLARCAADDAVRQRSLKFIGPIVAFAVGAVGGAESYVRFGFWALLAPVLVLGLLSIVCSGGFARGSAGAMKTTSTG